MQIILTLNCRLSLWLVEQVSRILTFYKVISILFFSILLKNLPQKLLLQRLLFIQLSDGLLFPVLNN